MDKLGIEDHVNSCYYPLDYLVFVAKKKPDDKSEIMVGGIITFIARKMEWVRRVGLLGLRGTLGYT